MSGREADADYEKRADHHRHRIRFAAFIDSIVSGDHSNDTYLVANNRLLDHPEAKPLWSDLPDGHGILDPTQPEAIRSSGSDPGERSRRSTTT
jgi:hypothetical protein